MGQQPQTGASSSELERGRAFFLEAFHSTRFANKIQEEAVTRLIIAHGYDTFRAGVEWAAKLGMSRGRAVVSLESALPKWGGAKRANGNGKDRAAYVSGEYAEYEARREAMRAARDSGDE